MGNGAVPAQGAERALAGILADHPEALVMAIDGDGFFVPPPASLAIGTHRVAHARSALDLVHPRDRTTVIDAWAKVQAEGAAAATVAIAGDGHANASLHLLDLRSGHGVFVGALVAPGVAAHVLDQVADIPAAPPRLVRTRKDAIAVIIAADDDLTPMLGWDRSEFIGRRSLEFIHPDDHDQAINTWMDVLGKPGGTCRARVRHQHRDGRWVWLEIANRNLLDTDGYVDCEMFDISEEMDAQEAVRANEQLLRRLAGALPVGVIQFDLDRRLVYVNDRLREILGAAPDADGPTMFASVVEPAPLEAAIDAVLAGTDMDLDLRIERMDGRGRAHCTLALRALTGADEQVTGAVGCLTDITDSSRMRAELEQRATYDDLTGCINRATTLATLDRTLASSGLETAVIFIDLDDFKVVNDQFGHGVGDSLLVAIAGRLREAVRVGDMVGRFGGDEFLVICSDVADPETALGLGDRIADATSAPLSVGGVTIQPRASIGIAWVGDRYPGTDAEALIAHADAAMYASKAAGQGRPVLAGSPARAEPGPARRVGDLAPQLRQAIARRQLDVHFQRIVDLQAGVDVGFEALLRWRRQDRVVPAQEFIAAAETTGLICEVGPWVIDEVCRQAIAAGRPDLKWFVHVSPRQLATPRTVAAFGDAIDRHGIDPAALVIEITEHAALHEAGMTRGVVAELRRLGLAIALNDFGTGHSCLSTLLEVPASFIKIDRRFTSATASSAGRQIVAGVVDMAGRVGAATIAEGIETEAELAAATDLGVTMGQGYLLARPAALDVTALRSVSRPA
ncbi:MAG: hypothetical protein NVSMB12_16550 [Acidimicrobiales bacterium]